MKVIVVLILIFYSAFSFAETPIKVSDIEKAYKREYIFLSSQKRSLEEQKKNVEKNFSLSKSALEKDIKKLKLKWLAQTQLKERLGDQLINMERGWDEAQERESILETTIRQGRDLFKKELASIPVSLDKNSELQAIFSAGISYLENAKGIKRESGKFFLQNGEESQGELLHIGNIASLGKNNDKVYSLAPAGIGQLKVWKELGQEGEDLFAGKKVSSLPIFLYENMNQNVALKKEASLVEFIEGGGAIGLVIIFIGIISAILCLVRYFILRQESQFKPHIYGELEQFAQSGEIKKALQVMSKYSGAIPRVIQLVLKNIDKAEDEIESLVAENFLSEQKSLERFSALILVFASVAPLLGLLGTVTGMISTFDIITEHGTGNPKLLSGGISEALITTELGLIVAIPVLLTGQALKAWATRIQMSIEEASLKMWNLFRG